MAPVSLQWSQVNAWRLSQQCLAPRLGPQELVQAVERTGGLQAQVMSAAEISLGTRVNSIHPRDAQSALWQERTLVKTWAMRATLHLIAASDLPLYAAARSLYDVRNWPAYFEYFGVSRPQMEAYLAAAPLVLDSQPMTREQFATAVAREINAPELRDLMISKGWGTPLKPLAWSGDLCFGPSDGRNVTFVNARKWLGEWRSHDPYAAFQEVARRYLRSFGPANVIEFAQWWGVQRTHAKMLFKSLQSELEPVEVEGWPALALRETLEPMRASELNGSVRLLPLFDAFVMGIGRGAEIEPILPRQYQPQVFRPQGWITAVVLVDGTIRGVWEHKNSASQMLLKVRLFSESSNPVWQGIEAEAGRLGEFLGRQVTLEKS